MCGCKCGGSGEEGKCSDPWKAAVIDELVVLGILNESHESDPRKAIQDIIKLNMQIALDPKVSGEARALMETNFKVVGHVRSQSLSETSFLGRCPEVGTPLYVPEEKPISE